MGLPVVSTFTPAGGKGISQTQTSYTEGISFKYNHSKVVLLETSREIN